MRGAHKQSVGDKVYSFWADHIQCILWVWDTEQQQCESNKTAQCRRGMPQTGSGVPTGESLIWIELSGYWLRASKL